MQLIFDFRHAADIAAWLRQAPERRARELQGIVAAHPAWAEPAREAWRVVQAERRAGGQKSFPKPAPAADSLL